MSSIKERLNGGELIVGSWLQTGSPSAAEILGGFGFDFLTVDMEHTDISEAGFTAIARALPPGTAALARVPENNALTIRRVLDSGAQGVIVPLIQNAQQARQVVQAVKYPPLGARGYAFCRANIWGSAFGEYAATANDRTCVIVMIETREGIARLEEILAVEGVDGVLVGLYDLSGSFGVVGQLEHPMVQEGMHEILALCKRHNKAVGQHIVNPTPENVDRALQEGYTFLALGMDTVFLADGAGQTLRMKETAQKAALSIRR